MTRKKLPQSRFNLRTDDVELVEDGDDDGPLASVADGDWDKDGNPRTDVAKVLSD